jgi:hypothetical protein
MLWLDIAYGRVGSGGSWRPWDDSGHHGQSMPVSSRFTSFTLAKTNTHHKISLMDDVSSDANERTMIFMGQQRLSHSSTP